MILKCYKLLQVIFIVRFYKLFVILYLNVHQ